MHKKTRTELAFVLSTGERMHTILLTEQVCMFGWGFFVLDA